MLCKKANPLTREQTDPTADLESIRSPVTLRRKRSTHKRDIRDQRRTKTAAEALAGFDHETEIYGFTKGQFSVIDLLKELLRITGPADLVVSTWTAARADITTVLEFVKTEQLTSARWLVDLTFQRRSPELAESIRRVFGKDAIRVGKNHAKFALISGETWKIVLSTSMNLNFNPRFENFCVKHDPELYEFHERIINEIWRNQPRSLASSRPGQIEQHFFADM